MKWAQECFTAARNSEAYHTVVAEVVLASSALALYGLNSQSRGLNSRSRSAAEDVDRIIRSLSSFLGEWRDTVSSLADLSRGKTAADLPLLVTPRALSSISRSIMVLARAQILTTKRGDRLVEELKVLCEGRKEEIFERVMLRLEEYQTLEAPNKSEEVLAPLLAAEGRLQSEATVKKRNMQVPLPTRAKPARKVCHDMS